MCFYFSYICFSVTTSSSSPTTPVESATPALQSEPQHAAESSGYNHRFENNTDSVIDLSIVKKETVDDFTARNSPLNDFQSSSHSRSSSRSSISTVESDARPTLPNSYPHQAQSTRNSTNNVHPMLENSRIYPHKEGTYGSFSGSAFNTSRYPALSVPHYPKPPPQYGTKAPFRVGKQRQNRRNNPIQRPFNRYDVRNISNVSGLKLPVQTHDYPRTRGPYNRNYGSPAQPPLQPHSQMPRVQGTGNMLVPNSNHVSVVMNTNQTRLVNPNAMQRGNNQNNRLNSNQTLQSPTYILVPQQQQPITSGAAPVLMQVQHGLPNQTPEKSYATTLMSPVNNMQEQLNIVPAKSKPVQTSSNIQLKDGNKVSKNTDGTFDPLGSKNPIPTYTPPRPPEIFQMKPPKLHKCNACGDSFLFESSLDYHIQRRSLMITTYCDTCKVHLMFYNKCQLHKHISSHKYSVTDLAHEIKKAKVKPLPKEMMPVVNGKKFVYQEMPEDFVSDRQRKLDENSKITSPKKNADKVENKDSHQSLPMCLECKREYNSYEEIDEHYGRCLTEVSPANLCAVCKMHLPSKCSLSAHRRLHIAKTKPFVCPECGHDCSAMTWDAFQNHLYAKCLHFSRVVKYTCPICKAAYDNLSVIEQHIITAHGEAYYKCQSCPMAFKSEATFNSHKSVSHPGLNVDLKVIFKCPTCDTVFHGKNQLVRHVNSHIQPNRKLAFKCLNCLQLFDNKAYLVDHMKREHHNWDSRIECGLCSDKVFKNNRDYAIHMQSCHRNPNVTQKKQPLKRQIDVDAQIKKKKMVHSTIQKVIPQEEVEEEMDDGSPKIRCKVCNTIIRSQKHLSSHAKYHRKGGVYWCTHCNEMVFSKKEELVAHVKQCTGTIIAQLEELNLLPHECGYCEEKFKMKDDLIKHLKQYHGLVRQFPCHLCGLTYETNHSLRRHIQIIHEGRRRTYTCWVCGERDIQKTFTKRGLLEKHLIQKHKLSKHEIDYSKMPKSLPDSVAVNGNDPSENSVADTEETVSPIKRLRLEGDTNFSCAKCDFTTENQDTFNEHIAEHKSNDSVQCPDCGMCFVVATSLKRHLFIVHKVRDLDKKMKDSGIPISEGEEPVSHPSTPQLSWKQTGDSFECTVCYRTFDNEVRMRGHMRTHGVAFIRSKRHALPSGITSA